METKALSIAENCIICLSRLASTKEGYYLLDSGCFEIRETYNMLAGDELFLPDTRVCFACSQKLKHISEFRQLCLNSKDLFVKYSDENDIKLRDALEPEAVIITKEEPCDLFNEDNSNENGEEEKHDTNVGNHSQRKKSKPKQKTAGKRGRKPKQRKPKVDRAGNPCREEIVQAVQCSNCDFIGQSINQLAIHVRKEHVHQPMVCPLCSSPARNPSALVVHFTVCPMRPENNDIKPNYMCPACGELVFRLHNHIETCHADLFMYTCHHCSKRFMQRSAVWSHLISVHASQEAPCDVCGKIFKSVYHVRYHQRLTHGVDGGKRKCDFCDYETFNKTSLKNHMKLHTNKNDTYVCEVCCKSFKTKPQLTRHQLCHKEGKPYVCTECGLAFKVKRYLQTHYRIHKPPQYQCPVCNEEFIWNQVLKAHVKKLHPGFELPPPGTVVNKKYLREYKDTNAKIFRVARVE